ncbi:Nickel transport system permease protein NikC [Vibrio aerogenes CECT 7868]|uniref:Nickel transport system permease protein NikC n=1 Tax=Vibrio aerogenes CECT 7868 TaxID=1216006 RepID=A0A1M5ZI34_9VIBR|nr:nickel ABC transporter permease subunit NikC [Vibrio aerogenes]SHI23784.1 Nickel transport system permease protein NikC [Vibrio aerogenes CECT 7868]
MKQTNPVMLYGAPAIALLLICCALFSPWLHPYDPTAIDLMHRFLPPSPQHWLGTDHLGRDILSRLICGASTSLGSVMAAIGLIILLGLLMGGSAGLLGGRFDQLLMRFTDVFMTFPTLILSLFMIGVLGTGLTNVIIAIALSHWPWYARIVRSIVLGIRHREYMLSARLSGASRPAIFYRHLLRPVSAQLCVLATLDVGHMMLHVAGMSFLGLGVQAPTPEWGVMINDARQYMQTQPQLIFWPGLSLLLSVLSFNLLGDRFRDYLDPHIQREHSH